MSLKVIRLFGVLIAFRINLGGTIQETIFWADGTRTFILREKRRP